MIQFGKAKVVREGDDLSVITYGATVQRSMRAAQVVRAVGCAGRDRGPANAVALRLGGRGASVRKTGRALVVHEDCRSFGYGAEIAAQIADRLFEHLDAPVRRVAALDTFVAYCPELEDAILPQAGRHRRGHEGALRY